MLCFPLFQLENENKRCSRNGSRAPIRHLKNPGVFEYSPALLGRKWVVIACPAGGRRSHSQLRPLPAMAGNCFRAVCRSRGGRRSRHENETCANTHQTLNRPVDCCPAFLSPQYRVSNATSERSSKHTTRCRPSRVKSAWRTGNGPSSGSGNSIKRRPVGKCHSVTGPRS